MNVEQGEGWVPPSLPEEQRAKKRKTKERTKEKTRVTAKLERWREVHRNMQGLAPSVVRAVTRNSLHTVS